MSDQGTYHRTKRWRQNHPGAWNAQKKRHDERNRKEIGYNLKTGPWTRTEVDQILASDRPSDRELSLFLHRPIKAIQEIRSKAKRGKLGWFQEGRSSSLELDHDIH